MARTAVVNPRGRGGRFTRKRRKRRRNYGAASANPRRRRRRRRRNYGAAAANPTRRRRRRSGRRRRNPMSPYASTGYRRTPNPSGGLMDFDDLTETVPAATGGVLIQRFALRQAGPFEAGAGGVMEPGIKHAIALWIGAKMGGQLVGNVLGSEAKGHIATIAALGFAGDLFLTRRFARNNTWLQQNVSLQGLGDDYDTEMELDGFQSESPLGADEFTDAMGNRWVQGASGWELAGMGDPQIVQGPDGTLYQLSGDSGYGTGSRLAGFQNHTALGAFPAQPSALSSFGYSR